MGLSHYRCIWLHLFEVATIRIKSYNHSVLKRIFLNMEWGYPQYDSSKDWNMCS